MKEISRFHIATILIIIVSIFITCGEDPVTTNNPPQIDNITIITENNANLSSNQTNYVNVGRSFIISVEASDADNDNLTYSWTTNVGSLNGNDSSSVTWTAPNLDTLASITLQVSDGKDHIKDTLYFQVYQNAFLRNGLVSPGSGITDSVYSYQVSFYNPIDSAPMSTEVIIDGVAYVMMLNSGDFSSGALYKYETSLSTDPHNYRFRFKDHKDSTIYFPASSYKPGPIVTEDTSAVFNPDVTKIDDLDSLQLLSVADSIYTYTYTGTPPDIQVGDILFSSDSGGYLRKVESITYSNSKSNGQIIINTIQGTLVEMFETLELDTTITIAFDNSIFDKNIQNQPEVYLAPGVNIKGELINFDGMELLSEEIDNAQVDVYIESGSLDFTPSLRFKVFIDEDNLEIYCAATGTLTLELTPRIDASAYFNKSDEIPIGHIIIPLEVSGLPLEVVLSLYAGYEVGADVAGTASFNLLGESSVTIGGEYKNEDFSKVYEVSASMSASEPEWNAEANAHAKVFIRPEVSVKVVQVLGPYLDVVPYVQMDGTVTANPFCWDYAVIAGYDVNVGLELDAFIYSKRFNIPVYGDEIELYQDEDCPNIDVTPPNPITDLVANNQTCNSMTLSWTAPGDDGISGQASVYDIRYSTDQITESNWSNLIQVYNEQTPDIGGSIENYTFSELTENTTYYFAIKSYDDENNVSLLSNIASGTTLPVNLDSTGTVTDIDGNVYKTVRVGDQWWMVENLKVTHYRNGDTIPEVIDNDEWVNLSTGAQCAFNDSIYGKMYNWYALDDERNIAPEGWHVPTYNEWQTLINYLGGNEIAGGKLKDTSSLWRDNVGATNESGFTALPGGYREWLGGFISVGIAAKFWMHSLSDLPHSTGRPWAIRLSYHTTAVEITANSYKYYGLSVRCVKDE